MPEESFFKHYSQARVLVMRNDGLGDVVLTLPLVAASTLTNRPQHNRSKRICPKNPFLSAILKARVLVDAQ